jgi:pimeloyl-ACP methyl ester carboxylesterase/class 3 adenylate cyclase
MTTDFAPPQTRYTESGGLSIAYQVFGSGTQDLVVVPGTISHLEECWRAPGYVSLMRRLGQNFRVILFDKLGQGMSDRFEGVPTLERRMDDLRAVMHAVGSARAVLFALSEGGTVAALFTASFPALVERLVLYGTMARFTQAPDYPFMPPLDRMLLMLGKTWGTPASIRGFAPSRADDPVFAEDLARIQRLTASPSAMRKLVTANDQIDARFVLPQIRRPTLVIQRRGDLVVPVGNGRYLADHIPDAVYLETPGVDHFLYASPADDVVDALCRFAVDGWVREPSDAQAGRWLATVLFTDIVGSTDMAARLGDKAWSALLQKFHALGRAQLAEHRGVLVDTAGDGVFATFDGPARAIRCAAALGAALQELGIGIRAGLHTGEVEAQGDKVSGMAVHIGARVMSHAGAGEVLVSGTTKDLVAGSGITFETRGSHVLKGVPGNWNLYSASPG